MNTFQRNTKQLRRREIRILVVILMGLIALGVTTSSNDGKKLAQKDVVDILDKQEVLDRQDWWDNKDWGWYKKNIPFFESPNPVIDEIYYYRWELMTKHLVYGSPETGYTFTEFMDRPFWSGTYGGISCPLGHQLYEVRWLKNPRIINDFSRYWFETPGAEPRSYSNWYGDSIWGIYKVNQDKEFIRQMYPYMVKQYNGFVKEHYNTRHGMFMWDGMHDGMEVNINGRQTDNEFSGGDGYRPTLNSYMYADLKALSKASNLFGNSSKAEQYDQKAEHLKKRVQEELWDPNRHFFFHQFAFDELNGVEAYSLTHETGTYAGSPHGREEIGFVPWQFNLPDPGYEEAWKFLMDEDYFYTDYGPTTTEQGDPMFNVYETCCKWSGNSWPYATTQTLVAMANLLHNYKQDVINKDDYFELLKIYAKTQHKNGRPYIAEAANPYTGSWEGHDNYYHSEHYLHSGYINNVITGLVGLRPQADNKIVVNPQVPESWDYFALEDVSYHGHNVSIVWDREGNRYDRGKGLILFVDDKKVASSDQLQRMEVEIDPVPDKPLEKHPVNFAVNNEKAFFPHVSASSTDPEQTPYYAVDGNYWYHESPANRWTSTVSGNQEWMQVDFGVERPIEKVKLYFLDDGEGVRPPEQYRLQVWNRDSWNSLKNVTITPNEPVGHQPNIVDLEQIYYTEKVRVIMDKSAGQSVGLTEFEIWGHEKLPIAQPVGKVTNLAFNPDNELFPIYSASYTHPGSQLGSVSDMHGLIPYNDPDRWSAQGSPNQQDWIEINLGPRKQVQQIDIQFLGSGNQIGAPEDYSVEYMENVEWKQAEIQNRYPETPQSMALNTVTFSDPLFTHKLRIHFKHKSSLKTAISEIMVW